MDSLVAENLGKCYILGRGGEDKESSAFRERNALLSLSSPPRPRM